MAVNPHDTGCIGPADTDVMEGPSYMWDGRAVLLNINFDGAPAAPDPGSIYSGSQVIMVRTDGSTFPDGDPWKCITCGVPSANEQGISATFGHPQAFHNDMQILAGTNIVSCAPNLLTDPACTPDRTHIYPLFWADKTDPTAPTGNMRELRLDPDDVHIGFSHLAFGGPGGLDEISFFGRLSFDSSPTSGAPLVPRYDIVNSTALRSDAPTCQKFRLSANQKRLIRNRPACIIGELRGFTADGRSALGIDNDGNSDNTDLWATNLTTGRSTRITDDPGYEDPIGVSADGKWYAVLTTQPTNRMTFAAGMEGVPPLTDMISEAAIIGMRNNGNRRFFQPVIVKKPGERGDYQGQQLNAGGDTGPGGISDPNWNARANPAWSPDGTNVVFWQALVTSPACGGSNPIPCPASTEPGGRRTRLMIARLTSRRPEKLPTTPVPTVSDSVPWGIPYAAGDPFPTLPVLPSGTYALDGKISGSASVQIADQSGNTALASVSVSYTNYSDEPGYTLNGTESATASGSFPNNCATIHEDLTSNGVQSATKATSEPNGLEICGLETPTWTGSMTTTFDGTAYTSPASGT